MAAAVPVRHPSGARRMIDGVAESEELVRYREEMGHDPPSRTDHPLDGQWDYRGTREEREALEAEVLPPPPEQELLL